MVAGRGGVGCVCGVGMPLWLCLVGAAAGVSLYFSAVLFTGTARVLVCARLAFRMSGAVVGVPICGVFFCVRCCAPVRLFVCRMCPALSRVAGLLRFILVVGYCVGVRFVSAPASDVMWFMQVCVGVRLTATVVVAYSLLCNGRFQRLALSTGMPVVFVSVSHRHKGWWGGSGVRGRWRLVAR